MDDTGPLAARMSTIFPWMLALSPQDRETCTQDQIDAARASFATDQPHRALAEITSWKETAAALAAGLHQTDLDWLGDARDHDDDDDVVERP